MFEVTNSLSRPELDDVLVKLIPHLPKLSTIPSELSPIVLDAPQLNLELSGIALSFLPRDRNLLTFRARLWDTIARAGVMPRLRYALPSAHVTIGRFVEKGRGLGLERSEWVKLLQEINKDLEQYHGEWKIEKVLVREGALWYGGGKTLSNNCGGGRLPN